MPSSFNPNLKISLWASWGFLLYSLECSSKFLVLFELIQALHENNKI